MQGTSKFPSSHYPPPPPRVPRLPSSRNKPPLVKTCVVILGSFFSIQRSFKEKAPGRSTLVSGTPRARASHSHRCCPTFFFSDTPFPWPQHGSTANSPCCRWNPTPTRVQIHAVCPALYLMCTPCVWRTKPSLFFFFFLPNSDVPSFCGGSVYIFCFAGLFCRRSAASTVLGPAPGEQRAPATHGASPWTRRCARLSLLFVHLFWCSDMMIMIYRMFRRPVCLPSSLFSCCGWLR